MVDLVFSKFSENTFIEYLNLIYQNGFQVCFEQFDPTNVPDDYDRSSERTQQIKNQIYEALAFTKEENYLDNLENVRSLVTTHDLIYELFQRI